MNATESAAVRSTTYRVVWSVIAALACLFWAQRFVESLRPQPTVILDFFQEWASARNWMTGLPVYEKQSVALVRHLGAQRPDGGFWLEFNAHPPGSVMLALPFAALDYPEAMLVWNLLSLMALGVSLWLIAGELRLEFSGWDVLPLVALGLMCNPLRQQINQGQLNLFLLLLITGVWIADRRGWKATAGMLVGAAAFIKLFPLVLAGWFLFRRAWRSLASTLVTLSVLAASSIAILGLQTYHDYLFTVMPLVSGYRDWWANVTITGFWSKLLDGGSGHVIPLVHAPLAARIAIGLTSAAVLGAWAWLAARSQNQPRRDLAFATGLAAMVLVSPIAWDHYFLLLALPAVLAWRETRSGTWSRRGLIAVLTLFWLNPAVVWRLTIGPRHELAGAVAQPWHAATVLAYQFYALAALFGLMTWLCVRHVRRPMDPSHAIERRESPAMLTDEPVEALAHS